MNEKEIVRLVRSVTLKINYAGHTILVDSAFADEETLKSALGRYKSSRAHLVMSMRNNARHHGADMSRLIIPKDGESIML
ncbi:hypothetical protein H6B16_000125 [Caecibacteroides pullorum]|nr:hypothetical protein [Caecibacteroides pullorum]